MNETQPLEEINSTPTEAMPEPARKPLTLTSMMSNHLDYLQTNIDTMGGDLKGFYMQAMAQARYAWHALFAVAAMLLLNAVLSGVIIYELGVLIGHVR